MKTNRMLLLIFLIAGVIGANAQNTTLESEVPGDNFSLEGALELFKKSASPEEFERKLNETDSKVNNLDLNNDGEIDYIRVIDRNEGNVHAFILQAVLSSTESQDVAVIELEKLENGRAVLQIVGDADVYGIETIIEPTEEVRVNAGTMTSRTVVNVWTWPSVQYVYGPYYSVWVSPWSWSYYPFWWRPWAPVAFYVYHPWWNPYRPYYSYCYSHRIYYGSHFYNPYRRTSVIVYNNYRRQIDGYRSRNDRYHNGRRDRDGYGRYDGSRNDRSRYGDRNRVSEGRYSGRDRNDGRERFADNRRSGTTSGARDLNRSRFENNNNVNERRSAVGGRGGNESGRSRMTSPERNVERSSPNMRSTPDHSERNTNFERNRAPERSMRQAPSQQSHSPRSYSSPGRSSSPSYRGGGGSSGGSRPSFNSGGSGNRNSGSGAGRSSGGGGRGSGGDRGSSGNSRGRH